MVDLGGENAIDLELDHRHATRSDREFAFAAESEQPAVALDLNFLRQLGGNNDVRVVFPQLVTAARLETLVDAHEQLSVAFEPKLEMMIARMLFLRGDRGKFYDRRLLENFVGDFIGICPPGPSGFLLRGVFVLVAAAFLLIRFRGLFRRAFVVSLGGRVLACVVGAGFFFRRVRLFRLAFGQKVDVQRFRQFRSADVAAGFNI